MMIGSGTRLRDVCALRYDIAQSHLTAWGGPGVTVTSSFPARSKNSGDPEAGKGHGGVVLLVTSYWGDDR